MIVRAASPKVLFFFWKDRCLYGSHLLIFKKHNNKPFEIIAQSFGNATG